MKLPSILLIYQATEKRNLNKSRAEAARIRKDNFLKSIFCVTRTFSNLYYVSQERLKFGEKRYIVAHSNAYEVAHMMIEWPPTYK